MIAAEPRVYWSTPMSKTQGLRPLLLAAAFVVSGTSGVWAQAAAPPPVLLADDDNRCGWALAGAAAGVGLGAFAGSRSAGYGGHWSGLYVGGHLGCAWGDTQWTFLNTTAFATAGGSHDFDNTGWIAGGQIGFNQQVARWVMGIEATISAADVPDQVVNALNPAPAVNTTRLTSDINSIVTITGRLGYLLDPRWMGYVKAGYASADIDVRLEIANAVAATAASASSRHNGWTLGAGVEFLASHNIVLGLEYGYISLGDKTYQLSCAPLACGTPTINVDPEAIHTLTGRISFKFGGPPGPLK
jgi:outer membrane immunogenic protein